MRNRKKDGTFSEEDTESRFWSKVDSGDTSACWNWIPKSCRYGKFFLNGRTQQSSRVAYTLANGPIPNGMNVLHKCDNPSCCNPSHLFLGSQQENVDDMVRKGRKKTAARRGELNTQARLSQSDAEAIKSDPRRQHLIASDYGISRTHVSGIKSGKYWK